MEQFMQFKDGSKVEISDETAANFREQFSKEKLIEVVVDGLRISERIGQASYPILISILKGTDGGKDIGDFNGTGRDLPGDALSIEQAIKARDTLDKLIKKHS